MDRFYQKSWNINYKLGSSMSLLYVHINCKVKIWYQGQANTCFTRSAINNGQVRLARLVELRSSSDQCSPGLGVGEFLKIFDKQTA